MRLTQNYVEITLETDLDDDRVFSWEQYKLLLNYLPLYSKKQAYVLTAGMTGFRPEEVSRLKIENLLFQDRQQPMIVNKISKYKKKWYYDAQGRVIATKILKIKKRLVPLWVRDFLEEYIRRNWQTMANGYLFPDGKGGHIGGASWCAYWSKLRKKMLKDDAVLYGWVNDPVAAKVVAGKVVYTRRLSGYSFRKSRATWYAMACLEKGVSDVLLSVAHFMGHGSKSIGSTYVYVKKLVADRLDMGVEAIKPPDLNENILGVENRSAKVDAIIRALLQDPDLHELIQEKLKDGS